MITLYTVAQFTLFGVFCLLIWPFRHPRNVSPLLRPFWIYILRLAFVILVILYVKALSDINHVGLKSAIAYPLNIVGVLLIALAKKTLRDNHTPAGYFRINCSLVQFGIYRFIRHPLYAGIISYMLGGLVESTGNLHLSSLIVEYLTCGYIAMLLIVIARREDAALMEKFGEQFAAYSKSVSAVVPKHLIK